MMTAAENDDFAGRSSSATLDCQLPAGRSNRARTWMSAALGIVIFVAGTICGAAATRLVPEPRRTADWSDLLDRAARRMQRDLDLTEAQQASIKEIVRAHQPQVDRIRVHTIGEMRTELQQVIEETAAVLTPEQARRFRTEAQSRLDSSFRPAASNPLPSRQFIKFAVTSISSIQGQPTLRPVLLSQED